MRKKKPKLFCLNYILKDKLNTACIAAITYLHPQ
jgi:hypothetical protein